MNIQDWFLLGTTGFTSLQSKGCSRVFSNTTVKKHQSSAISSLCDPFSHPWLRQESICLQWGRPGFNPWVRKIPWRRKWQPTPLFLLGEFLVLRSLVGYNPQVQKKLDMTERLRLLSSFHFAHIHTSVQFSRSVVSDSLRPHESQHVRPPCPSPTPRVYSNSCPLCQWCYPAISSSVVPFSSCPQSFPASGSFPMNQLFASGGQRIGVSDSNSVLPMNTQDWFPLGRLVGSLCSPRDSQESYPTPPFKSINTLVLSLLYSPTLTSIHAHWKNHSLDQMDLWWQSNVSAF